MIVISSIGLLNITLGENFRKMKTILIATDFSPASRSAGTYAADLGRDFNSRLILASVYQPIPLTATESIAILSLEEIRKITCELLQKEARMIESRVGIVPELYTLEDDPADGILSQAKKDKADLIIVGTKQTGKRFRKVFGSTITALANHTSIPLLIVPEGAKFTRMDTVAVATNTDVPAGCSEKIVDVLKDLGERYHSKVYMVRVVNKDFSEASRLNCRPGKLFQMLRTLNPMYECHEGEDTSLVLTRFLRGYHVDLLVMFRGKHSILHRWFGKSIIRTMIFESKIPILVLPENIKEQIKMNLSTTKTKQLIETS